MLPMTAQSKRVRAGSLLLYNLSNVFLFMHLVKNSAMEAKEHALPIPKRKVPGNKHHLLCTLAVAYWKGSQE